MKTKTTPTLASAKVTLAAVGVTITRKSSTDEYRVNLKDGKEATAYYTVDLQDAIDTGLAMGRLEQPKTATVALLARCFWDPNGDRLTIEHVCHSTTVHANAKAAKQQAEAEFAEYRDNDEQPAWTAGVTLKDEVYEELLDKSEMWRWRVTIEAIRA